MRWCPDASSSPGRPGVLLAGGPAPSPALPSQSARQGPGGMMNRPRAPGAMSQSTVSDRPARRQDTAAGPYGVWISAAAAVSVPPGTGATMTVP